MQFLKLSHELITDKNITSHEFRIYTYLLSLYNEIKQCAYPSIETISIKLNISIATVNRSIKRLVELGYMVIEKKKGAAGNFNTYKDLKYYIRRNANIAKKSNEEVLSKSIGEKKPIIVSDWKESGVQIGIEEITPFTIEHQQKISLVLKYVKELNEKQMFLVGETDLELLRKAIYRFRKTTKTHTFTYLVDCYYTECAKAGEVPSMDLQRYHKKQFISISQDQLDREIVKAAMIEDGIFNEQVWKENIVLGL